MTVSRRNFCKIASGLALGAMVAPVPLEAKRRKRRGRPAKRVLIIAFDGIRVDGLAQADKGPDRRRNVPHEPKICDRTAPRMRKYCQCFS